MTSRYAHAVSVFAAVAALSAVAPAARARSTQAAPGLPERIAALKQSLQESQAQIRRYEWVETTTISLKGEEKSRKQERCYYGADGALQKMPIGEPAAPQAPAAGGRRGGRLKARVVENKKDEMKEYMEQAVALIRQYVPPDPANIQRAKDANKVAATAPAAGRARLEFTDFIKSGDRLSLDVDAVANRLLGLNVATYLAKPEDAVTLGVDLGALPDGTSYTAQTTLNAPAKQITVVIQNTGYRPLTK